MTSCARKITSISRFTGTTIVPVTTSSLDAGSLVSRPSAASPPAAASSSSGFVAPNLPSGPGYRKYQANCIHVTSTRTALASGALIGSTAEMERAATLQASEGTAVSPVQTTSRGVLGGAYAT